MLTENQQIVFNWLNDKLQLPVFAEAYRGALDLLDRKSSGYITFVSHAGRDLMNGLAATVKGIESQQDQQRNRLDELQNHWKNEWGTEGINKEGDSENGHLIPYRVCEQVKNLIDAHKAGRLRASDKDNLFFTAFLDYADKERIPQNFVKEWRGARRWFQAHVHLRKPDFRQNAPSEVAMHFRNLDNFLYVAASSEFERIRGIHEILEETNE